MNMFIEAAMPGQGKAMKLPFTESNDHCQTPTATAYKAFNITTCVVLIVLCVFLTHSSYTQSSHSLNKVINFDH